MRRALGSIVGGCCALVCAAGLPAAQDTVELDDGTRVEGRVVLETSERIVVRKGSRDRELARAKVKRLETRRQALDELLRDWCALEPTDVEGTLALAKSAQERGLAGEAEVLALSVLAANPENETAHLCLGHERRGDGWLTRLGAKKLSFARRIELSHDFGDAWELTTSHYALTTNLDLAWACALAFELELFYRNFYDWFGSELALYEVLEPMATQVHADKQSYPDDAGRIGYFDSNTNRLVELALEDLVLSVLAHEATHQILHNTALATRVTNGAIPPWLDEGLAEFLSSARSGPAGRALYRLDASHAAHFATHRSAKKPYDLGRLLTFSTGDFAASSKVDLKYAQAYTLVHFCLVGKEGTHREGFMSYLADAYRGKGSSSDFKSALAIDERRFEKAWSEYVAAQRN